MKRKTRKYKKQYIFTFYIHANNNYKCCTTALYAIRTSHIKYVRKFVKKQIDKFLKTSIFREEDLVENVTGIITVFHRKGGLVRFFQPNLLNIYRVVKHKGEE